MASLNIDAQEFHPNQLHKLQCPTFPSRIISLPHHHKRFTLFAFHQPNPFFFYTTPPFSPSEAKPTHLEIQEHQQQQQQEKKEAFKILSCEKTVSRGPRLFSNGGLRFQAFEWRKKEPKKVVRERKYCEQKKDIRASSSFFQKRVFPVVPVRPDGDETTVMIKNIPSKYKTGMNKGYAFVNFIEPKATWKFLLTASDRKWELFNSHKIRQVVLARIQGMENLENHFETMNFPYDSEDVLAVFFSPPRDGASKGDQKTLGRLLKGTHHI